MVNLPSKKDEKEEKEEADALECPVCFEQFADPRILPCLHSFCRACLDDVLQANAGKDNFPCPSCRNLASLPAQGAQSFPPNGRLNDLIGKHLQHHAPEDKSDPMEVVTSSPSTTRQGTTYIRGQTLNDIFAHRFGGTPSPTKAPSLPLVFQKLFEMNEEPTFHPPANFSAESMESFAHVFECTTKLYKARHQEDWNVTFDRMRNRSPHTGTYKVVCSPLGKRKE